MEGIYNERNASNARVLHGHESEEEKESRKVTASMQKAQDEHDKYLKKLGYVPKEQRQKNSEPLKLDKLWDNYDNRVQFQHLTK